VIKQITNDVPKVKSAHTIARSRCPEILYSKMPGQINHNGIMKATSTVAVARNVRVENKKMLASSVLPFPGH
jgi:hypothetical protein